MQASGPDSATRVEGVTIGVEAEWSARGGFGRWKVSGLGGRRTAAGWAAVNTCNQPRRDFLKCLEARAAREKLEAANGMRAQRARLLHDMEGPRCWRSRSWPGNRVRGWLRRLGPTPA